MKKLLLTLAIATSAQSLVGMEKQLDRPVDQPQCTTLTSSQMTPSPITFAHPPSRETRFQSSLNFDGHDGVMSRRSETKTDKQHDNSTVDYSKFSPITFAQIYYYFAHDLELVTDIIQQIFLLQLELSNVDLKELPQKLSQNCKNNEPTELAIYLNTLINSCGYLLASELCEQFFAHEKILLCDIKNDYKSTSLHSAIYKNYPKVSLMLIKIAGDKAPELITMQNNYDWTALHYAAKDNHTESVKLLLNAAGDKAPELIAMKNDDGKTAFDLAKPVAREIMQQYMTMDNKTGFITS